MGHSLKMIAPQFVKPYVKSNKNDALDAEAICEAVQKPTMHFVPAKALNSKTFKAFIAYLPKRYHDVLP